jgi:hypothetical protein
MKLTEKQLAELFINNSKTNQASFDAGHCLNALPASPTRLSHAESVLNDFHAAQGMKLAFSFKNWSNIVAKSIQSSQQSWFNFFGMNSPFKTALATAAFAFAFVVALPQLTSTEQTINPIENNLASDIINSVPFEGNNNSDHLSSGGFDGSQEVNDNLFNASFG